MSSGKWRPFGLGLNVLTVDLTGCRLLSSPLSLWTFPQHIVNMKTQSVDNKIHQTCRVAVAWHDLIWYFMWAILMYIFVPNDIISHRWAPKGVLIRHFFYKKYWSLHDFKKYFIRTVLTDNFMFLKGIIAGHVSNVLLKIRIWKVSEIYLLCNCQIYLNWIQTNFIILFLIFDQFNFNIWILNSISITQQWIETVAIKIRSSILTLAQTVSLSTLNPNLRHYQTTYIMYMGYRSAKEPKSIWRWKI